ncbi:trypsin-like peptidase domain-containing protein [Oscillospiraceae bacterium Marseille-Q3528]|nr:trypsin-like peptidase domain-containing protein [Oscillospiraceae bacterium Marseille-Q3528]
MYNDYSDTARYSGGTENNNSYGEYHYSNGSNSDKHDKKDGGKNKFMKSLALCIVLALVFGVVAGAAFQVTGYIGSKVTTSEASSDQVITDSSEVEKALENAGQTTTTTSGDSVSTVYDVSAVAEAAMPSLVSITNMGEQEIQSFFGTYTQASESSGTGIIVGKNDDELLIATNNHVVEGSEQLNVCFIDNEIVSALVKGTDATNDLAVIAVSLSDIPEETLNKISIAQLGDSESLKIGEPVIAIGNALGYGQSVTTGVISALDREVTIENMTSSLIQTDAAINPGNSGGALLNMQGQVIGINSAKLASSQVEGMGYAIPISTAEPIIDDLMNRKTRTTVDEDKRGYLGISGVDVTSDISKQMGIPTGAYVAAVVDGSAADKAGLKKGDVITKFDGSGVSSMTSLKELMSYYEAGETVDITFKRADNGEYTEQTVQITLSDQSAVQQDSGSQNNGNAGRQGK